MFPSPPVNFADAQPCSDPAHGTGLAADVERALCKQSKIVRRSDSGAVHVLHAHAPAVSKSQPQSLEEAKSSLRHLALLRPIAVPRSSAVTEDKKWSPDTSESSAFAPLGRHVPAASTSKQCTNTMPSSSPLKESATAARTNLTVPDQLNPSSTSQSCLSAKHSGASNTAQHTSRLEYGKCTPPSALSANGKRIQDLREWDKVEVETEEVAEEEWEDIGREEGQAEGSDGEDGASSDVEVMEVDWTEVST